MSTTRFQPTAAVLALAVGKRGDIATAKAPRVGLVALAGGDAYGAGQGTQRGRADTRQGVRQRTDPPAKVGEGRDGGAGRFVFRGPCSAPGSPAAEAWNLRRCQRAGRAWRAEPPKSQPFAPAKVLARKAQGWFRQRMIEASRNSYRRAHRWKEARIPIAPGRYLPLRNSAPPKSESRITEPQEFLPGFHEP